MSDIRLQIDKNSLDEEFVNQPGLIEEVCEEAAVAIAVRDTAEEHIKTVDAELDHQIRAEGIASKAKLTEASIAAAVQTHPRHQNAFTAYTEAKLAAAKAIALEKAATTKGKALEQLSELYRASYWVKDSSKGAAHSNAEYSIHRNKLAEARREFRRNTE